MTVPEMRTALRTVSLASAMLGTEGADTCAKAVQDQEERYLGSVLNGMVLPLTLTRPSAIRASASRREQSPARAICLAIRSGALLDGARVNDGLTGMPLV